jgi:hypothetical protein
VDGYHASLDSPAFNAFVASIVVSRRDRDAANRTPAPAFTGQAPMPGGSIEEISLAAYRGKWMVLCFYPLDFTFVCPTELRGFNDCTRDFTELEAEVIGGGSIASIHTWLGSSTVLVGSTSRCSAISLSKSAETVACSLRTRAYPSGRRF